MCVCKYQSNIYQRGYYSIISEAEFPISFSFQGKKRLLSMDKVVMRQIKIKRKKMIISANEDNKRKNKS